MRDKKKTLHFIGIGGVGMSGLAEVFRCHGYAVQGSDIKKTIVTDRLGGMDITVRKGHAAENIDGADLVVYSSCIRDDNPEIKEARRRNVPVLRRIEAFNMLLGHRRVIAVSGSHGKTTTTSLVSYLLLEAGIDPTLFIGADAYFLNGNARCGKGDIVVTEADESDGSFLLLDPFYTVSTNVDREHMDYYKDMDSVIEAYRRFIENTKEEGSAFVCIDDDNLREIVRNSSRRILRYGFSQGADLRAVDIESMGLAGSSFRVVFKEKALGRIDLSIVGAHNILNSLAAIGVAMDLGVEFAFIKKTIKGFKGADRRFTVTHLNQDILLIDDYAHHPTEIKATLKAFEDSGKRIVAIFQPHRFSRTKDLKEEFGRSFDLADHLVITGIYAAHEEPIAGVSAQDLCESARRQGHKDVHFVEKDDIVGHLTDIVRPGDAVFVLGAGDIDKLPERIVRAFTKR